MARNLRILYVDTDTVWRGGQEQLLSLMKGMKARNHDVWLAAPPRAPLSQRATQSGVGHLPYHQRSELSPAAFRLIFRWLRCGGFQVVHFNTPKPILWGALAARIVRVPAVVASRRVNFKPRTRVSALKYGRLVDLTLSVSESIRQTLLASGVPENRVRTVYEGVDLEWLDHLAPAPPLFSGSAFRIGCVAFLSQEKGHCYLLRAVSLIRPHFPALKLIFIGEGPLLEPLQEEAKRLNIADIVLFTGFRNDCEALMKQLDIFCLPSLSEGLSSAVLSAMATRLPVVASRLGGLPELVKDLENGFLVPPADPPALAEALEKLLTSRELRRRMGATGRTAVEKHFTVRQKLELTENVYRELLERSAFSYHRSRK